MNRYWLIGAALALLVVEALAFGLNVQRISILQAEIAPVRTVIGKFRAWNFVNRPRLNARRPRRAKALRAPAGVVGRMALTQGPD